MYTQAFVKKQQAKRRRTISEIQGGDLELRPEFLRLELDTATSQRVEDAAAPVRVRQLTQTIFRSVLDQAKREEEEAERLRQNRIAARQMAILRVMGSLDRAIGNAAPEELPPGPIQAPHLVAYVLGRLGPGMVRPVIQPAAIPRPLVFPVRPLALPAPRPIPVPSPRPLIVPSPSPCPVPAPAPSDSWPQGPYSPITPAAYPPLAPPPGPPVTQEVHPSPGEEAPALQLRPEDQAPELFARPPERATVGQVMAWVDPFGGPPTMVGVDGAGPSSEVPQAISIQAGPSLAATVQFDARQLPEVEIERAWPSSLAGLLQGMARDPLPWPLFFYVPRTWEEYWAMKVLEAKCWQAYKRRIRRAEHQGRFPSREHWSRIEVPLPGPEAGPRQEKREVREYVFPRPQVFGYPLDQQVRLGGALGFEAPSSPVDQPPPPDQPEAPPSPMVRRPSRAARPPPGSLRDVTRIIGMGDSEEEVPAKGPGKAVPAAPAQGSHVEQGGSKAEDGGEGSWVSGDGSGTPGAGQGSGGEAAE